VAAHVDHVCIQSCLHAKALIQCDVGDVHDSDNKDEDTIDVDVDMLTTKFYRTWFPAD